MDNALAEVNKAAIGGSDHNVVFLLPSYRQKLKREKSKMTSVRLWDDNSVTALQGCFDCTDWSVFDCADLDEHADVVTSYVNFCVDNVTATKRVKQFANSKPWITSEIKKLLVEKERAFKENDRCGGKLIQKEIQKKIKQGKRHYKDKIERHLQENNSRMAWRGIKTIIGQNHHSNTMVHSVEQANAMNDHFARWENAVPANPISLEGSASVSIRVSCEEVGRIFSHIKIRKAAGPDRLEGTILKSCKEQLSPVFRGLYQKSLDTHKVPNIWKTAEIVPFPKKLKPDGQNDFRPVALTSVAMKCFERIILTHLKEQTKKHMDTLQFAYKEKRGVEDAVATLLNGIYKHLETPASYVRILFADFSSAFNTVQQHVTREADIYGCKP